MTRWIATLFIALIALTSFATPSLALQASVRSPVLTSDIVSTTPLAPEGVARPQAYREYRCRIVTASDIYIYATPYSTAPIGRIYQNTTFATTGIHNNRYHLYNPYNDTWGGWVTADPQWTNYAGHYCMG